MWNTMSREHGEETGKDTAWVGQLGQLCSRYRKPEGRRGSAASAPWEHGVSAPCRDLKTWATEKGRGAHVVASWSMDQWWLGPLGRLRLHYPRKKVISWLKHQPGKSTWLVSMGGQAAELWTSGGVWVVHLAVNLRVRIFCEKTFGWKQDGGLKAGWGLERVPLEKGAILPPWVKRRHSLALWNDTGLEICAMRLGLEEQKTQISGLGEPWQKPCPARVSCAEKLESQVGLGIFFNIPAAWAGDKGVPVTQAQLRHWKERKCPPTPPISYGHHLQFESV